MLDPEDRIGSIIKLGQVLDVLYKRQKQHTDLVMHVRESGINNIPEHQTKLMNAYFKTVSFYEKLLDETIKEEAAFYLPFEIFSDSK